MKTILIIWRERGYLRDTFWSTQSAPAGQAAAVARRLIAEARQNAGVFGLRVKIGGAR